MQSNRAAHPHGRMPRGRGTGGALHDVAGDSPTMTAAGAAPSKQAGPASGGGGGGGGGDVYVQYGTDEKKVTIGGENEKATPPSPRPPRRYRRVSTALWYTFAAMGFGTGWSSVDSIFQELSKYIEKYEDLDFASDLGGAVSQVEFRLPTLPFPSLPFPSLPFPSLPFPSLHFLLFPSLASSSSSS
jgi:hypothetical protein